MRHKLEFKVKATGDVFIYRDTANVRDHGGQIAYKIYKEGDIISVCGKSFNPNDVEFLEPEQNKRVWGVDPD